jgi:hemerythrin-like domain-containing protein
MDPHELLLSDHRSLRTQAADLRAALKAGPKVLTEKLISFQKLVQKHFKLEDIYYRVLDDDKRLSDRGLVHQLRNDHAAVVFTLESLAIRLRKNGVNEDWLTRFNNLMDVFLPHLDQEEKALFPIGRKTLSAEELKTIAEKMDASE